MTTKAELAERFIEENFEEMSEIYRYQIAIKALAFGHDAAIDRVLELLKKYREAYDESIFPTEDLSQFDPKIVTAVSGRMGRFILDNCINELKGGE